MPRKAKKKIEDQEEKLILSHEADKFSQIAEGLCRLKLSAEYLHEFRSKFAKYMSPQDKIEMASISTAYDFMYLKYWERLIKKIRGIE